MSDVQFYISDFDIHPFLRLPSSQFQHTRSDFRILFIDIFPGYPLLRTFLETFNFCGVVQMVSRRVSHGRREFAKASGCGGLVRRKPAGSDLTVNG